MLAQLETEANAATAKAKAKAAELNAQYRSFEALADNANRVTEKLDALKIEREALDLGKLQAAFSDHYRTLLSNRTQDRMALDLCASVIASRELRLSIIADIKTELTSDLRRLQNENVRLSRLLNLKRHEF